MFSARSVWLLSTCTALLGGAAGAGALMLVLVPALDRGGTGPDAPVVTAPTVPDADAAPDDPTVAALAAALDEAAAERSQLATTLVSLNRDIVALEQAIGAFNLPGGGAAGGAAATTEAFGEASGEASGTAGERQRARGRGGLDPDGLLAAGVDPVVGAELERRDDAWQLARLELVDRAAREGWEDSDQLEDQLERLDAERPDLREELGDERYDAYLYASGRPNRVVVAAVIPGSAAESAGLREGDIVSSYAGDRLFDIRTLQRASRSGSLGESVTVQALRDGQTVQVSIPRGPLGVSLERESVEP